MSLYNMLNGYNPACVLILPMLGKKAEDYPRFRDCFITDDGERIAIYTRVGGGNRNCGYGEEELYEDPNFVTTYDDDFDHTYATYEFRVPKEWKKDFEIIKTMNFSNISDEYKQYLREFYPTLNANGVFDKLFSYTSEEDK